jgi:hypothetical protein
MPTVTGSATIAGAGTASLEIYSSWIDRPYIMLNGTNVTDHGRTLELSVSQLRMRTNNTAVGVRRTFYPRNANKVKVGLKWKYLPDTSLHTSDSRDGRLYLKALASEKKVILLYIKNADRSDYNKFNVYVSKYDESIVMRRDAPGGVLYDVSMEFQEL